MYYYKHSSDISMEHNMQKKLYSTLVKNIFHETYLEIRLFWCCVLIREFHPNVRAEMYKSKCTKEAYHCSMTLIQFGFL